MSDASPSPVRALKRMLFQDSVMFTTEASVNFGLVEKVQSAAEAWINSQPGIEVVNIETLSNTAKARCVVWYREA